jgi:hypothetical protein
MVVRVIRVITAVRVFTAIRVIRDTMVAEVV